MAVARQIQTEGWTPVDTAYSIADIPKLIEKLGGAQLYGDDLFVPVRELIMNGMDAVRALRKMDGEACPDHAVTLRIDGYDKGNKMVIEDQGCGMMPDQMISNLLGFGTSGWTTESELDGDFVHEDDVSGQYGIGFFSVFMLSSKVRVISRRIGQGRDTTHVLEFSNGLHARPILYQADPSERMKSEGTRVEVTFDRGLSGRDIFTRMGWDLSHHLGAAFPASDVLLHFESRNSNGTIDGRYWQTEPAVDLLKRIEPFIDFVPDTDIDQLLMPIHGDDGDIVGRAALRRVLEDALRTENNKERHFTGCLIYKGAALSRGLSCLGILKAQPARAARDTAFIYKNEAGILNWYEQQIVLLEAAAHATNNRFLLADCWKSRWVAKLRTVDHPVAKVGDQWLTEKKVDAFLQAGNIVYIQETILGVLRAYEFESVDDLPIFSERNHAFSIFGGKTKVTDALRSLGDDVYFTSAEFDRLDLKVSKFREWQAAYGKACLKYGTDIDGIDRYVEMSAVKYNMTEEDYRTLNARDDRPQKEEK